MGLENFSRAEARGIEAHHRPPRHYQAMPKALMKMETLRRLRYIAKPNDHLVSFDLKDGFYAL